MPPIVNGILSKRPMKIVIVPDIEDWLDRDHVLQYPFHKSYAEARYEPFAVFHTSGSTGIPKVVLNTHGLVASLDAYQLIPALGASSTTFEAFRGTRAFLAFPLFHSAGIGILLTINVYYEMTVVLPPAVPLTADIADLVHASGAAEGSMLIPSILDDIVKMPSYLENLRKLKYVVFGGSPLPKKLGNAVRAKTKLYSLIGSTETHHLPTQL